MRIVSFNCEVAIDVGKHGHGRSVALQPGVVHVMATAPYNALVADNPQLAGMIVGAGVWETRLKPFVAETSGNGKTVLFYTGAGGLGDQVMAWPVVRHLSLAGYKVSVLADPGNDVCWRNFSWIDRVITLPVPLDVVSQFDHHAIFEHVTNADSLPDQLHPTDCLFMRMGLARIKIPALLNQLNFGVSLKARSRRWSDRPYGLIHVSATNTLRSLPVSEVEDLSRQLDVAAPQIDWLVVGDHSNKAHADAKFPSRFRKIQADSFEELAVACLRAAVGVGPDSLLMHLFGSFNRPFVAYFGPIAPNLRTRYYSSVRAVYGQGACQFAPCHALSASVHLPAQCPSSEPGYCKVAVAGSKHVPAQVKLALER